MSLADAIAASTPAAATSNAANRKSAKMNAASTGSNDNDRPRVNSAAFQVYEDKKNACESRIADIRARIVIKQILCMCVLLTM